MSETFKRGGCTACGACCTAIVLDLAPGSVEEWNPKTWGDKGFIRRNWTEIDRDEAFRLNPYLRLWDFAHRGNRSFFTCSRYDATTKRCGAYEDRPEVCRGYPHYTAPGERTRLVPEDPLYAADCGFTIDRERLSLIDVLAKIRDKRQVEESFIRKAMILRPQHLLDQDWQKRRDRIMDEMLQTFDMKKEALEVQALHADGQIVTYPHPLRYVAVEAKLTMPQGATA